MSEQFSEIRIRTSENKQVYTSRARQVLVDRSWLTVWKRLCLSTSGQTKDSGLLHQINGVVLGVDCKCSAPKFRLRSAITAFLAMIGGNQVIAVIFGRGIRTRSDKLARPPRLGRFLVHSDVIHPHLLRDSVVESGAPGQSSPTARLRMMRRSE